MGGRESSLQPVVLDDGAAPLGVTHGAHVSNAQRVTALVPTDVLEVRGSCVRAGIPCRAQSQARQHSMTVSVSIVKPRQ